MNPKWIIFMTYVNNTLNQASSFIAQVKDIFMDANGGTSSKRVAGLCIIILAAQDMQINTITKWNLWVMGLGVALLAMTVFEKRHG